MTIEYQLARITAQSKNADPKKLPGGISDITADDIRAAVSMTNQAVTYHALMAKYCDSRLSEVALKEIIEDASMRVFLREHPEIKINGQINKRLVECAMIWYLAPEQGKTRGDRGNANHCGVSRKTWVSHYRDHFHRVTRFLMDCESTALEDVRRIMRDVD